ncbi:MAG: phasin family protein [Glaciimonas sp.]|nr:phasin family protein [Glaciimonas sp.]
MQNPENALSNSYKNQLHATQQLSEAVLTCTEKIDQVVLNTTHALFNEQMQLVQALATSRDMNQIALLQSSFLSHTPDYISKSQKEMLQICQEMQNKVGKVMEQYFEHVSNAQLMPKPMMPMPALGSKGNSDLIRPMTDLFNVWSAAFKEASTLATHNIEVARTNFEKVNDTITEEKKAAIKSAAAHEKQK